MSSPRISDKLRDHVVARAKNRCEYCLCFDQLATESYQVDHIQPRALSGTTTVENLALACAGCNRRKQHQIAFKDEVTELTVPLYHPRQDTWAEHFMWSADLLKFNGITPKGRATVECLQLNRSRVINVRRMLLIIGAHAALDRP